MKKSKKSGKATTPRENGPAHLVPMTGKDPMAHSSHRANHGGQDGRPTMGLGPGFSPTIDDHCNGEQDPSACMAD